MNRLTLLSALTIVALLLSCEGEELSGPKASDLDVDIHIIGSKDEAGGLHSARYLMNDESINLPVNNLGTQNSKANAIKVDDGGNVYIAGSRDIALGKSGPSLWVNGSISPNILTSVPGMYGEVKSIYLGGGGIFAAGVRSNFNGNFAVDWSVSGGNDLSTLNGSMAFAIAGTASNKVVIYYEGNTVMLKKNSKVETVADASTLTDVAFLGEQELLIGRRCDPSGCTITLWRDRVPETLADLTQANAIAVYQGDVYVAGRTCCEAAYWKNGELVKLTSGGNATSIAVYQSHVILGGVAGGEPAYWLDGELHKVTDFTAVTGVALTPK